MTSPSGKDFRIVIGEAVASCVALLAVIGDNWVASSGDTNVRRIDDPKDYVRIELESALERSIPVIPVLVGNAKVPSETSLPDKLKPLSFRNAAEVRAGPHLEAQIDALCLGLASAMGASTPPPPPTTRRRWRVTIAVLLVVSFAVGMLLMSGSWRKSDSQRAVERASDNAMPAPARPANP